MELSSPRFKALATTAGFSFWFFIITSSFGFFSIELMISFISGMLLVTQIFAKRLSTLLNIFAIINTKIFLGILFSCVFTVYGFIFKILRIDLLRLKKHDSYWLDIEDIKPRRIFKQY